MTETGDLCEIPGELTIEWKIKQFSSISDEKHTAYVSPSFYFSGTSWKLQFYPNGDEDDETHGWIGLYTARKSTGFPVPLTISFAFKRANGSKDKEKKFNHIFSEINSCAGFPNFILRSELLEKKDEFIPSNDLTIICTLRSNKALPIEGSLFCRQQHICDNLKEIFRKRKRTDFSLEFDTKMFYAHRMILETQSPVFAAMLNHDTKENQTGQVLIEDVHVTTMGDLVEYMYCGDLDRLTTDNVLSLYAAARKYDVKHIRQICSEFIIRNLSVQWVCDVLKFADLYEDEEINRFAREYFKENANEILESEKWKIFLMENNNIAIDLLSTVLKTVLQK